MQGIQGVIDMHMHSAPDDWARAYNDFELLEAGVREGARAIVLKVHQGCTMDRAYLCNLYNRRVHGAGNDFTMVGSITLNQAVGGINPYAVETALGRGAKVVWLPTLSARNHLAVNHLDPAGCVDVFQSGRPVPGLVETLRIIRDHDAVLATGHLSADEVFAVAELARAEGVRKIVVTHPESWLVGMCLEDQMRAVREYDCVIERCYCQPIRGGGYRVNLADNVEAIQKIGYEHILLSTDSGQNDNLHWELCMKETVGYLLEHGIGEERVRYMTRTLPARLLGLAT